MATGKALISRKLPVEVDEAWEVLRGFGDLGVWFPSIDTCSVQGSGPGARRDLELADSMGHIVDYLRSIDEAGRRLRYERVESPFPVDTYWGTVEVFESYDAFAVVVWTVDYTADDEVVEGVRAILEDAIGAGVEGLGKHLSGRG